MIDGLEKTNRLLAELTASLPLEARPTRDAVRALAEHLSERTAVTRCTIEGLHYAGDEGGIVCKLNIEGQNTERAIYISITHLIFERKTPLFRQIDAYQRHRVKKLRQQGGREY
ncbi:hypothetical protein [Mesorhizobium sp. IMUNJ 23232]|uniref:hypothetical protein n=1 Tax=Mesorhizobium sp. IMUNJ 23232 TaxID=3376064 RepID=UPI00378779A9